MKVTELIDLVSTFAFGRNDITDVERSVYLKYLNLANEYLYASVTNYTKLLKTIDINLVIDETHKYSISDINYDIHNVLCGRYILPFKKYNEYLEDTNAPCYYYLNDKLYINAQNIPFNVDGSGNNVYYVTLTYVPFCKKLVERVENEEIETDEPIYPAHLQNALIFCAVYYLYLSDFGYKERIAHVKNDFVELRQKIMLFYSIEK